MRFCLLYLVCLIFAPSALAQIDAHYWTHQYGAKGLLLNGAVIASTDDETAIYYNPACMGQGNNLGFVFSFLTPTYSFLETDNLTSDGSYFKDDELGFSPGFAAVRFKPFGSDKLIVGVASFEKLSSNIGFSDRVVQEIIDFQNFIYVGDLEFSRQLSQDWIGFGLSYNFSDRLAIGFSQYSVWHDENLNLDFRKEANPSIDPTSSLYSWRSKFGYNISVNGGWLTKLGFIYNFKKGKVGLTMTSPSYGYAHNSASYLYADERLTLNEFDVISNRRDVDLAEFKTPVSAGLGMEMHFDKMTVSISTEYFRSIDEYVLFEDTDDPFDDLSEVDEIQSIIVTNSASSVMNFAFGFQRYMNAKTTLLWGFRTDFDQNSNVNINEITEYLSSSPSTFHFSGGVRFIGEKNQLSLGFDYGYGHKSGGRQLSQIGSLNIDDFFDFGNKNNVTTTTHTFMIFLTYDFLFGRIRDLNGDSQ